MVLEKIKGDVEDVNPEKDVGVAVNAVVLDAVVIESANVVEVVVVVSNINRNRNRNIKRNKGTVKELCGEDEEKE